MIAMGKPSENRFIAGEMRFSRPKQNCTRNMQNTTGSAISSAAESTQLSDQAMVFRPSKWIPLPTGQNTKLW